MGIGILSLLPGFKIINIYINTLFYYYILGLITDGSFSFNLTFLFLHLLTVVSFASYGLIIGYILDKIKEKEILNWNNLTYTKKGALFATLIFVIVFLIGQLVPFIDAIFNPSKGCPMCSGMFIVMVLVEPFVFIGTGALIGYIVGRIKKRKD